LRINLINDDCANAMVKMPDNSFDLVITSPPYNMNLRVRNGKHCSRQIVKEITTKYQGYDDNLSMEEYFEFNKKVLTELLRLSPLVFYNIQILTGNKAAIYKLMGEFHQNIKELILWDKINAEPAIGAGVLNSQFELILVLAGKEHAITRQFTQAKFSRGTLTNLWNIKKGRSVDKAHKATFPAELVERIILNFSDPGDHVFDPFMGTGTTGVVCQQCGLNFTGVELLAHYYESAKTRLGAKTLNDIF